MKILKIKNIANNNGSVDYKGLNIESFIGGSQIYEHDLTFCCVFTSDDDIIFNDDIEEITKEQYEIYAKEIKEYNEINAPITTEKRVSDLETLVLQLGGVI